MSTETKELQQPPNAPDADWFLQTLVSIAHNGPEFGLTLQVSGFLVSGTLVGGAKFFEGFATDFASGFPEDQKADVKKTMLSPAELIYKNEPAEGEDRPLPGYIHLKDARFFNTSGKPIPGNRGVWWRGRISEVAGFVLGTLSTD
jgi:hypothetical protein